MTSEQEEMYLQALRAYSKRRLPTSGLLEFAANNPFEVLRKHIWRLQRGLDDPMFGPPRKPLIRIEKYVVERFAYLCPDCAYTLEESTERAGEERSDYGSPRW